jgi:hypothetical protein
VPATDRLEGECLFVLLDARTKCGRTTACSGGHRASQRRVIGQHARLQVTQAGPRFQAQVIGERAPGPVECCQRVAAPPASRQGDHQQAGEAFPAGDSRPPARRAPPRPVQAPFGVKMLRAISCPTLTRCVAVASGTNHALALIGP